MQFCSINGVNTTQLSTLDRTIHYGDGVFTTVKIAQGKVVWLRSHIDRLKHSCQQFNISGVNWSLLEKEILSVVKPFEHHVLKVIISAGQSSKGYARGNDCTANTMLMINDFPIYYQQLQKSGVSVALAKSFVSINPMLAGVKHLNRLEQVLLKNELASAKVDDLLATNSDGDIIETITGNVFMLINNQWCTPKLNKSGVAGLARMKLLNHFSGIHEREIRADEIDNVKAMFTTECLMPLLPVSSLEGRSLDISVCKPYLDYLNEIS